MKIRINSFLANKSLCDGPGIRSLLFCQGCDIHCVGCQNPSSWDTKAGIERDVEELAQEIIDSSDNGKVTITGGEPLLQKEAVEELVAILDEAGMDIALYTGHPKDDVPEAILAHLTYLKYGPYKKDLHTSTMPFVGSTNQIFERIK